MQLKRPARVLGPYQEGPKWRVITISAQGRRSRIVRSEAEARALKAECSRSLTAKVLTVFTTLARALHEYEHHLRCQRSRQTWTHTMGILRAFLPEPLAPLTAIDAKLARRLAHFEHPGVRRIRRSYAMSTRRAVLGHARRFYDWAQQQQYVQSNPFAAVIPVGIVGTAMRRLYPDEVPRLIRVARSAAEAGDVSALGALLLGVMKLRSGQVLGLRVADVDLDGQRLQVANANGTAWRIIPQELLLAVRRSVEARQPSDLVLGSSRTGGVRPRNFLWRAVHRLCITSRVTPTSPRALRLPSITLAQSPPRPSRQHVVTFSRKRRLHTPVIERRRPTKPSPQKNAEVRRSDDDTPISMSYMMDRAEMMRGLMAQMMRRKT